MKKIFFLISVLILLKSGNHAIAQVSVNTDGTPPNNSAMLDVKSTTKGFLMPRMTSAEIANIASPIDGLQVYCTTDKKIYIYVASELIWKEVQFDTEIIPFWPCPGIPSFTYEWQTYNTVQIGTQCWMRENLNVGTRIDGSVDQTNNSIIEKYCFNNLESNCDIYGGLYQWREFMNYTTPSNTNPSGRQGICPTGWHVPSYSEWTQLITFLGGESVAGGKMKEAGLAHWASPNTGATNSSGFTALPGGYREWDYWPQAWFNGLSTEAFLWSSTGTNWYYWYLNLSYVSANAPLSSAYGFAYFGYSARCLKD